MMDWTRLVSKLRKGTPQKLPRDCTLQLHMFASLSLCVRPPAPAFFVMLATDKATEGSWNPTSRGARAAPADTFRGN